MLERRTFDHVSCMSASRSKHCPHSHLPLAFQLAGLIAGARPALACTAAPAASDLPVQLKLRRAAAARLCRRQTWTRATPTASVCATSPARRWTRTTWRPGAQLAPDEQFIIKIFGGAATRRLRDAGHAVCQAAPSSSRPSTCTVSRMRGQAQHLHCRHLGPL